MDKSSIIQNGYFTEIKLKDGKRKIQYTPLPISNKINKILKSDHQINYENETTNRKEINKEELSTFGLTGSKLTSKFNSDILHSNDLSLGGFSLQKTKDSKDLKNTSKKEKSEMNCGVKDLKLKSKNLLPLIDFYENKIKENQIENRKLLMELCQLEISNQQLLEISKNYIITFNHPNKCNINNK